MCTHAVCEWAALASWSLRGRASHSRWCCSWPLGRESPCYPSSLHTPAGRKSPSGDGVPMAAIKKVTNASVNISIHKIWIMLNHKASLTGIVHPKMKILSFTNPQVVSNLYEFLSSAEHKRWDFEECWETNSCQLWLPMVWEKYYANQWLPATVWLPTFFKLFSCVSNGRNSYRFGTSAGRVNKYSFWSEHPFKIKCTSDCCIVYISIGKSDSFSEFIWNLVIQ